jgi:hypothetical protein
MMTAMLQKKMEVPAFLGKGHGMTALAGLIIMFAANLLGEDATSVRAWLAFFVFLGGFLGGILVIAHVFMHKPPLWFALLHGGLGVFGLYLLFPVAF